MEIWKDIKGYEGLYRVSNLGNIYSTYMSKNMSLRKDASGYLRVNLCKNGKRETKVVHRIVMETFNFSEGVYNLQVNHLNEIKADNRLENLEWCTSKENINYGNHNRQIGDYRKNNCGNSKVKIICVNTGKVFESISAGAREYNIKCKSRISKVLKGTAIHCGTFNGEKLVWAYCKTELII